MQHTSIRKKVFRGGWFESYTGRLKGNTIWRFQNHNNDVPKQQRCSKSVFFQKTVRCLHTVNWLKACLRTLVNKYQMQKITNTPQVITEEKYCIIKLPSSQRVATHAFRSLSASSPSSLPSDTRVAAMDIGHNWGLTAITWWTRENNPDINTNVTHYLLI